MVSKISVGMSTTYIHLPQFKIQSLFGKTWTLNAGHQKMAAKKPISISRHEVSDQKWENYFPEGIFP